MIYDPIFILASKKAFHLTHHRNLGGHCEAVCGAFVHDDIEFVSHDYLIDYLNGAILKEPEHRKACPKCMAWALKCLAITNHKKIEAGKTPMPARFLEEGVRVNLNRLIEAYIGPAQYKKNFESDVPEFYGQEDRHAKDHLVLTAGMTFCSSVFGSNKSIEDLNVMNVCERCLCSLLKQLRDTTDYSVNHLVRAKWDALFRALLWDALSKIKLRKREEISMPEKEKLNDVTDNDNSVELKFKEKHEIDISATDNVSRTYADMSLDLESGLAEIYAVSNGKSDVINARIKNLGVLFEVLKEAKRRNLI